MVDESESIDTVLGGVAKAPARQPPVTFASGSKIGGGRYTVRRLLGRGGMGSVFLAYDEVVGKHVALKLVDERVSDRLRDEVRLAHEVTHRNVCRTFDLEQVDDRWVVKMEFVDGVTLANRVTGPLPITELVAIARQIVLGLQAAHERGVVHRDLKPDNIIIEAGTDRVVLTDFGLARLDASDGDGEIAGTPAYMAPEQARGGDVDRRADSYALGCVLYVMATGQIVFPAESPAVMIQRHLADPPPDPRAARADMPIRIAQLIRRLLDKDPARRPSDAEVIDILQIRRRRWIVAACMAIPVLAITAFVWSRPPSSEWRPVVRDIGEFEEYSTGPVFSPDGSLIAYASDRGGSTRIYVESVADGTSRVIGPPDRSVWAPRWTRDGKAVLCADYNQDNETNNYRVPIDGSPIEILGTKEIWLEDCGRTGLVFVRVPADCPTCNEMIVRDSRGHERQLLRIEHGLMFGAHCDAAGDNLVYSISTDGMTANIWAMSTAGGTPRKLVDGSLLAGMHPDGRSVVAAVMRGGHQNIWEFPLDGSGPSQVTFGEGPDQSPEVSPDGKQLVFATGQPMWENTQIWAYAIPGGAARKLTSRPEALEKLAITPDGKLLIAGSRRGGKHVIVTVSPVDGEEHVIGEGTQPALTVDGRDLVFITEDKPAVYTMPLAGGPRRFVMSLGDAFGTVDVGGDGSIHVGFQLATWQVPLAGGTPTREAPSPWVRFIPAPTGGWKIGLRKEGSRIDASLIAPGDALDHPTRVFRDAAPRGFLWLGDGTSFIYCGGTEVHRITVTGRDDIIATLPADGWTGMTISPDGATLYVGQGTARTKRHLITNFGDRR